MAILTLNINVPAGDLPDLVAALSLRYATNGNPNPTQSQLRAASEDAVRQDWIALVTQYRRAQVDAGVVAPVLS